MPRAVKALRGRYVCEVACGAAHTLVLTSTGEVYSCGIGVYGALGHGDLADVRQPKLVQVTLSPARPTSSAHGRPVTRAGTLTRGLGQGLYCLPVVQVAAGENHSAALTSSGTLYTWGRNKHSQARARPAATAAAVSRCLHSEFTVPHCRRPHSKTRLGRIRAGCGIRAL